MRRVTRPAVLACALVLLTAACSGPKPSLSFGGKAVPVNVSFGRPAANDPRAPNVPFVLGPVLGGVGVIPVALPGPKTRGSHVTGPPLPPIPVQSTCPAADPTDVKSQPRSEAGRDLGPPPKPGVLPYRIEGSTTAQGKAQPFSGVINRTVSNTSQSSAGDVLFDVTTEALGVSSTATYQGTQATDQLPGSFGLKAVKATGRGIDAQPSFNAPKAVELMQLRPTPGLTWSDATFDPLSATAYSVNGKVIGKDRIDACGQFVDAWQVVLSQGVNTPFQQIHSEITDWIATQYGGLIVQESVSWHGYAGTDTTVAGEYTATVDRDPGA